MPSTDGGEVGLVQESHGSAFGTVVHCFRVRSKASEEIPLSPELVFLDACSVVFSSAGRTMIFKDSDAPEIGACGTLPAGYVNDHLAPTKALVYLFQQQGYERNIATNPSDESGVAEARAWGAHVENVFSRVVDLALWAHPQCFLKHTRPAVWRSASSWWLASAHCWRRRRQAEQALTEHPRQQALDDFADVLLTLDSRLGRDGFLASPDDNSLGTSPANPVDNCLDISSPRAEKFTLSSELSNFCISTPAASPALSPRNKRCSSHISDSPDLPPFCTPEPQVEDLILYAYSRVLLAVPENLAPWSRETRGLATLHHFVTRVDSALHQRRSQPEQSWPKCGRLLRHWQGVECSAGGVAAFGVFPSSCSLENGGAAIDNAEQSCMKSASVARAAVGGMRSVQSVDVQTVRSLPSAGNSTSVPHSPPSREQDDTSGPGKISRVQRRTNTFVAIWLGISFVGYIAWRLRARNLAVSSASNSSK